MALHLNQKTTDKSFADFYLSQKTLQAIAELGYTSPTPVQAQSIPLIIAGIDLTVMSQTGTGKTAAFAIPTVEIVDPTPGQIDVLVLAPTRELAIQVSREFENLGKFKGINVATIYGGASYDKQVDEIHKANIVVATPGRLVDLVESGRCDLSGLKHFILDEADEMLSMGFAEDLDKIIDRLPETRQSLLFSATISNEVKSLAKKLLFYPEFISMSDDSVAAKNVTHVWYPVRGVGRTRELLRVIEYEQPEQAIVFANTKVETVQVTDSLVKHGIKARVINGDLPQKDRERVLKQLKDKEFQILVATDVAARGIDISGLTHVFNYAVPDNAEVYIHRAGRTGRAGNNGRAISLVSPAEFPTLHAVKKHFGVIPIQTELPTTHQIIEAKRKKHLQSLSTKLEQDFDLPYGAKLGLATQLVQSAPTDPLAVKLIARLLTLSDYISQTSLSTSNAHHLTHSKDVNKHEDATKTTKDNSTEPSPELKKLDKQTLSHLPSDDHSGRRKNQHANHKNEHIHTPKEKISQHTSSAPPTHSHTTQGNHFDESYEKSDTSVTSSSSKRNRRRDSTSSTTAYQPSHTPPVSPTTVAPVPKSGSRRRRRRSKSISSELPVTTTRVSSTRHSTRTTTRHPSSTTSARRKSGKRSSARQQSHNRRARRDSTPQQDSEIYVSTRNNHLPFSKTDFSFKKMWINLGASNFSSEAELRDALIHLSGFGTEDFGKISLETSFSYVDIREDYFDDVVEALTDQTWGDQYIAVEAARK